MKNEQNELVVIEGGWRRLPEEDASGWTAAGFVAGWLGIAGALLAAGPGYAVGWWVAFPFVALGIALVTSGRREARRERRSRHAHPTCRFCQDRRGRAS